MLISNMDGTNKRRWMMFVDGENFLFRGVQVAKENNLDLPEGSYYQKDSFLWTPEYHPWAAFGGDTRPLLLA